MLTRPPTRNPSLFGLLLAAAAITSVSLLAPRVLADDAPLAPLDGPFRQPLGPDHDPLARYQGELSECYQLARAENDDLVIHALAQFEVDPKTYRVTSATVPTPESPIFQACVEERALNWSFPPPADMPPPPADMPKDAKLLVAVYIDLKP